jgi:hypothetical protein
MTIVTDSAPAAPAPVLLPLQTFLKLYSLSKSEFYRMCSRGEDPDLVRLGRRTLIPTASAAACLPLGSVLRSRSAGRDRPGRLRHECRARGCPVQPPRRAGTSIAGSSSVRRLGSRAQRWARPV